MRRGCVSLGEIKCDLCGKVIPAAHRYLAETGETETGKSRVIRHCMDCCIKAGWAEYRSEKGEQILTIFPEKQPLRESVKAFEPEPGKASEAEKEGEKA